MYDDSFVSWLQYRADMRDCKARLKQGSRSFYAASLLLPSAYRVPIIALYAYCRVADDRIDCKGADKDALAELKQELGDLYAGRVRNTAVDRAFADLVSDYRIPQAIPEALIDGFAWDIEERRYNSLSDLYGYAARVAGTVGTMMAMIMGVRDPAMLSRACDLGVAMQLTNIVRDVGEDAGAGRLYLPQDLMRQAGLDPDEWLARPHYSGRLADVLVQVLANAERLYRRADWGLSKLPAGCRPAMFAARYIYAEIGREVERLGYDSVSQRAIVSGRRKLHLLGQAATRSLAAEDKVEAPPLTEVRFLLDALSQSK